MFPVKDLRLEVENCSKKSKYFKNIGHLEHDSTSCPKLSPKLFSQLNSEVEVQRGKFLCVLRAG